MIHGSIHRDADDNLSHVLVDRDLLHRSDFRATESHWAVPIEPARFHEAHRDVAAAEEPVANDEITDEEDRDRGHDPHPRSPVRSPHGSLGRLLSSIVEVVVLAHPCTPAVFHMCCGSKSLMASMIRAMSRNSGVTPGPATMSSTPRKSTIGAAMAAMKGMIIGHRTSRCKSRYMRVRRTSPCLSGKRTRASNHMSPRS